MGEHARYNGEEIKIGTGENMFYLRWDQAHLVQALPRNTDPVRDADEIRFRFPFPDEDNIEPGGFPGPRRGYPVAGVTAPGNVEHDTVQFADTRRSGYLMEVPCPEGPGENPFTVHLNGFVAATSLTQQQWLHGHLAAVLMCNGCGITWVLPELEDAEPVIQALNDAAAAKLRGLPSDDEPAAIKLRAIAARMAAGYAVTLEQASA